MDRILGGSPLAVIFRLIIISIIVGVILSALGLSPLNLYDALTRLIEWVSNLGFDAVELLLRYFLLGAAVVVPIWLILRVIKTLGGDGRPGAPR